MNVNPKLIDALKERREILKKYLDITDEIFAGKSMQQACIDHDVMNYTYRRYILDGKLSIFTKSETETPTKHVEEDDRLIAELFTPNERLYCTLQKIDIRTNWKQIPPNADWVIERCLSCLTEREAEVVADRVVRNLTFEEIGKEMGVTRERIRQIEAKAHRKLRRQLWAAMRYAPGYEEEIQKIREKHEKLILDEAIARYKATLEEEDIEPLVKKKANEMLGKIAIPIEELDLSVRAYNCLKRSGINTVNQLQKKNANDLMKIPCLGQNTLREIMAKLEEYKPA